MRIRHEELALGPKLGEGSQGAIYRVQQAAAFGFSFPLIYKEFAPKTAVSGAALELMATFRANQGERERAIIDQRTVWPCAVVVRATRVCGYVMQAIPDTFLQTIVTMTGSEPIPREVQHLFVSEDLARKNLGEIPTPVERLTLARELAFVLGFLHKRDLVFGDLSYKNAVYTLRPTPMVMLLDCDAVRFKGQGAAVAQLNSPGWGAPEKGPQTIESDRYKLALFVLRCLTPGVNAQNRDPEKAARVLDADGMALLRRGVGTDPHARPSGKEWVEHLDRQIAARGGVVPRTGAAARPAAPPRIATRATPAPAPASAPRPRHTAPYPLPPLPPRAPAPLPTGSWVQPHRAPSHVRAGSTTHTWRARVGSAPSTYAPSASTMTLGRFAVIALWVVALTFFGVAALASLVSSSNAASPSTTRTTLRTSTTAPDVRPPVETARAASEKIQHSLPSGWTIRSVHAGDEFRSQASLGNYKTTPSAWTFEVVGPASVAPSGQTTRAMQEEVVRGNELVVNIVKSEPATEGVVPVALPADWFDLMARALALAGEDPRIGGFTITYGWLCNPIATTADDCVWRVATVTGASDEYELYVRADGSKVVPRPTWR